jgi:hypothetical protein
VLITIIAVGVATGIDVSYLHVDPTDAGAQQPAWMRALTDGVETATNIIFSAECTLKIVARGRAPRAYFTDPREVSNDMAHKVSRL